MMASPALLAPLYLRVAPADIALVKFLLESYEGVGIVRTLERHTAVVVVLVTQDFLPTAREILRQLQAEIACVEVAPPLVEADDWLLREID
ncbi:MAG: DUF4911 domain-containing protein [Candidatus Binatia bacterium]